MNAAVDLKGNSGLDIKLETQTARLLFGQGLNAPVPAVRDIDQMREVLLDSKINEPGELYYMYRDVYRLKEKPLLEANSLRYDVTVIKPDALGRELMKTAGHYHPKDFGELYEVLEGNALCLLQRPSAGDFRVIEDVIAVKAQAGQKIVIPPRYGHILINPGPGCLVTSNWVSSRFSSEYGLYKQASGAAYFVAGNLEFIKNQFFKELPAVSFARPAPCLERFGLKEGEPMYPIITRDAARLDFLNQPAKYEYSDVFIKL